jgi:hypothetical protein
LPAPWRAEGPIYRSFSARAHSQKGNQSKINPQSGENFRTRKVTINQPQITTIPPQIHRQKTTFCTPVSPKTPAKTMFSPHKKISITHIEKAP